jgi:hypothetical protein
VEDHRPVSLLFDVIARRKTGRGTSRATARRSTRSRTTRARAR